MIAARLFAGLAAGFLLAASGAFVAYGWRAGVGCLAAAAVGAVLSHDVDKVTRESRWQLADRQRAAQALRDAQTRVLPDLGAQLIELRRRA